MYENFIALDREKRDKIINAAMWEFSAKGFKNASTNEIVKRAGISKGALFHYFASKRDLFQFLFQYSMDFFLKVLYSQLESMSTDVFERWIKVAVIKMRIAAQHPEMVTFIQNTVRDQTSGLRGFLTSKEYEEFATGFSKKIYDGIDLSKFKPDIDIEKALQMIWWVLEGFAMTKQKEPFDLSMIHDSAFMDGMMCEVRDYLGTLKKAFYREEYL